MQLLAPDIIAEARGLSITVPTVTMAVGMLLWGQGGRSHRFWLVLVTTLAAGVFGLRAGPGYGVQPLVAGLLMAVAAGALTLALVRVVAFAAGGGAALVLVHTMWPTWDEPLISFLCGGLLGLLLFRLWIMALTSLSGTLLAGHSILCLVDQWGKLDAVSWTEKHTVLLNWSCTGVAIAGLTLQFIMDRRRSFIEMERAEEERLRIEKEREKEKEKQRKKSRRSWWTLGFPGLGQRRAG